MSDDKTTYVVETQFKTKDESSAAIDKIGHSAHEAHEHAESLKETLKEVGEAFLLFEAVEKGKEAFVGFNSELQQTRIMLTSVVSADFNRSWDVAKEKAGGFYEEFEQFAEKFPTSVNELARNAQILGGAVGQAGGNMEDLKKITEGSVVASKAFGVEANQLFMMLEGHVSKRSAGAMALLNTLHMSPEEWQRLTAGKRLSSLETAMSGDTMQKAGTEFADSFAGQATMIKDKIEMGLAKVGLPLFREVNQELARWNDWMEHNKEKIEEIGHVVGEKLVAGFDAIKTVAEFLYDHSGILIKIAEAWAAVKLGGMMGGLGGAGGAIGGVLGKGMAGYALGGFGGGLVGGGMGLSALGEKMGLGKETGMRLQGFGVGYMIGEAIMKAGLRDSLREMTDPTMAKFLKLQKSMELFDDTMREAVEHGRERKGAAGTTTASLLGGLNEFQSGKLQTLQDINAQRYAGAKTVGWKLMQKQLLESAGFDPDEVNHLLGNKGERERMIHRLEGDLGKNRSNLAAATSATDAGIKFALEHFNKDQKAQLDVAKATQQIMQEQLQLMASGKQAMSPEQVAASLVAAQEIARINGIADSIGGAKINQTVNIHIDQVSAKDPDRWLADVDEYAARRVRSRTKAKNALARGL